MKHPGSLLLVIIGGVLVYGSAHAEVADKMTEGRSTAELALISAGLGAFSAILAFRWRAAGVACFVLGFLLAMMEVHEMYFSEVSQAIERELGQSWQAMRVAAHLPFPLLAALGLFGASYRRRRARESTTAVAD